MTGPSRIMLHRRWLLPALVFAGLLWIGCGNAQAHGTIKGINDFQAGMVHPVTELIHVLPILVLGILLGQRGLEFSEPALSLFPLAVGAGVAAALVFPQLHGIAALNVASAVVLGVLVAAAAAVPRVPALLLVVLFGLTHGYGNGTAITSGMRVWMFAGGTVLSTFLVMAYGLIGTEYLLRLRPTWLPIAIRVVGSWAAAIGLLVISVTRKTLFAA